MEGEILFLLLLALIVLGPRRLPEIGRQLGKALAELRRAKYEFSRQIEDEIRAIEHEEAARKLASSESTAPVVPAEDSPAETKPENKILPPRPAPAGTIESGSSAKVETAQLPAANNS